MSERRELSREFIAKNEAGDRFIRLSVRNDGPRLVLTGAGGIECRKGQEMPEFTVQDEKETLRLKGWWSSDELSVSLYDEEGKLSVFLKVNSAFTTLKAWGDPPGGFRDIEHQKDRAAFEFYDKAGQVLWQVTCGPEPPLWKIEAEPGSPPKRI